MQVAMDITQLISIMIGGGGLTALLTYFLSTSKLKASQENKMRAAIMEVLDDERKESDNCQAKVEKLTLRIEELILENGSLARQVLVLQTTVEELRELLIIKYVKE